MTPQTKYLFCLKPLLAGRLRDFQKKKYFSFENRRAIFNADKGSNFNAEQQHYGQLLSKGQVSHHFRKIIVAHPW